MCENVPKDNGSFFLLMLLVLEQDWCQTLLKGAPKSSLNPLRPTCDMKPVGPFDPVALLLSIDLYSRYRPET